MQWQNSKLKKKWLKKETSGYHFKTNKTKTCFCLEIFTYGHCSVHLKEHYGGKMCTKKQNKQHNTECKRDVQHRVQ